MHNLKCQLLDGTICFQLQQALYKCYIMHKEKNHENDFIIDNGAVEFNMVVQHVCTKGLFF